MKQHADGYIHQMEFSIRQIRGGIAFKSLIFAGPLLIFALLLGMIWLTDEPPEEWRTETVRYAGLRRVGTGRGGTKYLFVAENGQQFRISAVLADVVEEQLALGDTCQLTYRHRLGVASICGLVRGDEVIIDKGEYEVDWEDDHGAILSASVIVAALAALAAGLTRGIWCRKDRLHIADIRRKIARHEANLAL